LIQHTHRNNAKQRRKQFYTQTSGAAGLASSGLISSPA